MSKYGRAVSALHAHSTKDSSTCWTGCAIGAQHVNSECTGTAGRTPIVSCCRCRAGVGTVRGAERRAPLSSSSASQVS
eukprot:scaffold81599_cov85-Phaeocystis_antarctica.AAC.6